VRKYVGGNCHNNEVTVDYVKRTVRFRAVGKESLLHRYWEFVTHLLAVWFVRLFFPFVGVCTVLTIFLLVFFGVDLAWFVFSFLFKLNLLSLLFVLTFSLNFWRVKWRDESYPKFNYWMSNRFQDEYFLVVNKRAVIDKRFLLPVFENVGMKYEASGDFAKYLLKIEVISLFDTDEGDWLCCFTFKEQPLKGRLKLRYI
jgi:hypothetical protein